MNPITPRLTPRLTLVRPEPDRAPVLPLPRAAAFRPHLRPVSPQHLRAWLRLVLNIDVPTEHNPRTGTGPLAYLWYAFHEPPPWADPKPDAVVWACRGGGKTFYAALATALDLLFKPGIEVKTLGGSLEQSQRLHAHLRRFFEHPMLRPLVDGAVTERRLRLINGSTAQTLAQSHTSVRGTRPHKLRCDEAELFDQDVWSAAQLAPRSATLAGQRVHACIEALSTCHEPHGLMSQLITDAHSANAPARTDSNESPEQRARSVSDGFSLQPVDAALPNRLVNAGAPGSFASTPRRLFKWGVIDVLEHCPPERPCAPCPLLDDCRGRAKVGIGHVSIDDAIRMKQRVSPTRWESEMLCLRPRRDDSVYPEFDESLHIRIDPPTSTTTPTPLAGMDFGFRSPTVFLWALHEPESDTLHIFDEHSASRLTIEQHFNVIESRGHARPTWVAIDPAGRAAEAQSGLSHAHLMTKLGYKPRARPTSIAHGIELVRARLAPRLNPHGTSAAPRLTIHPRCNTLIESLTSYHYPAPPNFSNDPVKDGPDHAADALRYLITNLDARSTFESQNYMRGKG
ncbi:MAG: hypothetical protein ACKVZJ_14100 [Phycisphaerales bacterium]